MQIEALLFNQVASFSALPIAWPGVPFDKPTDNRYLEVIHFPNDPIDYDWRDYATVQRGILQLNVHWTRNIGVIEANDMARSIAAMFAKNTIIGGSLMVINPPSIAQWVDDFIPVRVSYRSVQNG